jgi:hypothetical protein
MEILFELLFGFVGELLLQIVFEVFAAMGLRRAHKPFYKAPNPWLAAMGYLFLGAVAGFLSLFLFPTLFMTSQGARIANLVIAPVVAGAAMAALGAWRQRRDQDLIRLDRFAYGYLFALAMAAVRFAFAG